MDMHMDTVETERIHMDTDIITDINTDINMDINMDISMDINTEINTDVNTDINTAMDMDARHGHLNCSTFCHLPYF
jgi:predicted transglutaminase-like cysteine proteinase